MASERSSGDWCFIGKHELKDLYPWIIREGYYTCMPCYTACLKAREAWLDGDKPSKRKVDSDSESHPNPAPKKISTAPLAPASSSSSSPLLSCVSVCPSNESLFKKLELLAAELEHLKSEVGGLVSSESKMNARLSNHHARLSAVEEKLARQTGKDQNIIESLNRAHARLDKAGH